MILKSKESMYMEIIEQAQHYDDKFNSKFKGASEFLQS